MRIETPVLRILSGRLSGTEQALPVGGTVSIGHAFWHDVVVRDPATKGIAIDLSLNPEGAAQATVLEGEAELLGSTVAAGETAIVPPYVPFTIGGVAMAWGDRDSERWHDATGLVATAPAAATTPPSARDHALAFAGRAGEGATRVLTRSRIAIMAGAIGIIALASAAVPVVDALHLRGTPAQRVERALTGSGIHGLSAHEDESTGAVGVTGVVANDAQRTKAVAVMRDTGIAGNVAVVTSADLARSVVEVARMNGLQGIARPIGRTSVELRVTPLAPDQEQKLVQAVRGDVRALTRLALRDDLPPIEAVPLRSVQDATKKVSTVVGGEPSFIQTVDGARYFPGAVMPSGHRLIAIQGNNVVFEKSGRQTRVAF